MFIALSCLGCGSESEPPSQAGVADAKPSESRPILLQLNWYPEAEHGGYYAALVEGIFDEMGLDVEIRPGSRATPVAADLTLGRADLAIANAADVLLYREQGADIVAVMAAMQDNPRCILVRQDSGVESFDELAGQTLQLGTGRPFVKFLEQSGVLAGVQVVPYFGTVAHLVATPNVAQQGFIFSEPLLAEAAGTPVKTLMVSDLGFNPYASVLVTSGKILKQRHELVEKMVRACQLGWTKYLESPAKTNEYIVAQNKHGLTLEVLSAGVEPLRHLVLPPRLPPESLGMMTAQRWETLARQMVALELVSPDKVRPEQCYENLIEPANQYDSVK